MTAEYVIEYTCKEHAIHKSCIKCGWQCYKKASQKLEQKKSNKKVDLQTK